MDNLTSLFDSKLFTDPRLIANLLITIFLILTLWLIRRGILQLVIRRTEDSKTRYSWQKISGYILYLLLAILILPLWLKNGSGLTTYLGLVSAGVAIALKDPLTNLVGWAFILLRHPFRVGDRIQLGDQMGDVIDVRVFQFSLMEIGNWVNADQSTGRIIHIPNGHVFTLPLANYTSGFSYICCGIAGWSRRAIARACNCRRTIRSKNSRLVEIRRRGRSPVSFQVRTRSGSPGKGG